MKGVNQVFLPHFFLKGLSQDHFTIIFYFSVDKGKKVFSCSKLLPHRQRKASPSFLYYTNTFRFTKRFTKVEISKEMFSSWSSLETCQKCYQRPLGPNGAYSKPLLSLRAVCVTRKNASLVDLW